MSHTISRLFAKYEDARAAVNLLESNGIQEDDISIVSRDLDSRYPDAVELRRDHDAAEGATRGAGYGGLFGGIAGLLASVTAASIPGLGPVVGAGWLLSTSVGATAGALLGGATGGIVGALTEAGVHPADADRYAEGLRRGGTLVTVRAAGDEANTVKDLLYGYHVSANPP